MVAQKRLIVTLYLSTLPALLNVKADDNYNNNSVFLMIMVSHSYILH